MPALANLETQIGADVVTFWGDVDEMNRFARMVSFNVLRSMQMWRTSQAELLPDMMQTVWEVALRCYHTNPLMPKGQIVAMCKHTLFHFVRDTLYHGDVYTQRKGQPSKLYKLIRFHSFVRREEAYSVEDVLKIVHGSVLDHQPCTSSGVLDPELALVLPVASEVDQWLPELEEVVYRILSAMKLHGAPHARMRHDTNRRQAFIVTCRLRGLCNHQIATATGRCSDHRRGRMRVGADLATARRGIVRWLGLSSAERDIAMQTLTTRHPNFESEPFAYPTLDRDWLWSELAYTIQTGNGQMPKGKR